MHIYIYIYIFKHYLVDKAAHYYLLADFSPFEFHSTTSYPFFLIIKPKISAIFLSIHYLVTKIKP